MTDIDSTPGEWAKPKDLPTTVIWYPLQRVIDLLRRRRFGWIFATETKYMELRIRLDTRDDHCLLFDRGGTIIAENRAQLEAFFGGMEQQMQRQFPSYSRRHSDPVGLPATEPALTAEQKLEIALQALRFYGDSKNWRGNRTFTDTDGANVGQPPATWHEENVAIGAMRRMGELPLDSDGQPGDAPPEQTPGG